MHATCSVKPPLLLRAHTWTRTVKRQARGRTEQLLHTLVRMSRHPPHRDSLTNKPLLALGRSSRERRYNGQLLQVNNAASVGQVHHMLLESAVVPTRTCSVPPNQGSSLAAGPASCMFASSRPPRPYE